MDSDKLHAQQAFHPLGADATGLALLCRQSPQEHVFGLRWSPLVDLLAVLTLRSGQIHLTVFRHDLKRLVQLVLDGASSDGGVSLYLLILCTM
jgi:hypothetical protein